MLLRPGVPLRYPADVDTRRFPDVLKLNLDVRGAGLLRREDNRSRPDGAGRVAGLAYKSRSKPVNLQR